MIKNRRLSESGFVSPPIIFIIISMVLLLVSSSGTKTTPAPNNTTSKITEEIVDKDTKSTATATNTSSVIEKTINPETDIGPTIKAEPKVEFSKPTSIVSENDLHSVNKVVDGDTIDVLINGKIQRLRLIGINTPETVDPRKPVECFGVESSNKAKLILTDKKVRLEADISQGELDTYGRLLRYVFLEDGTNFNLLMIKDGYAYEYTYNTPYKYQTIFKQAQKDAERNKLGLWGDVCQKTTQTEITQPAQTNTTTAIPLAPPTSNSASCTIKGNISSTKEKIFHIVGCGSYSKTVIDESKGERWFCSEQEALDSGWRKALNCP